MSTEQDFIRIQVVDRNGRRASFKQVRIDTEKPRPNGPPLRSPLCGIGDRRQDSYLLPRPRLKDPNGKMWVVFVDGDGNEASQPLVAGTARYVFGDTAVLTPKQLILFLAADPIGEGHVRLEAEVRDVRREIRQSPYRDDFVIDNQGAIRFEDLRQVLLYSQPTYIHISGHGDKKGNILIEDDDGKAQPLGPGTLVELIKATKQSLLRCVVLSTCYSKEHAVQLAEIGPGVIPHVVGIWSTISVKGSCRFARGFYNAIAARCDVPDAFDVGRLDLRQHCPGEEWMLGLFPDRP